MLHFFNCLSRLELNLAFPVYIFFIPNLVILTCISSICRKCSLRNPSNGFKDMVTCPFHSGPGSLVLHILLLSAHIFSNLLNINITTYFPQAGLRRPANEYGPLSHKLPYQFKIRTRCLTCQIMCASNQNHLIVHPHLYLQKKS